MLLKENWDALQRNAHDRLQEYKHRVDELVKIYPELDKLRIEVKAEIAELKSDNSHSSKWKKLMVSFQDTIKRKLLEFCKNDMVVSICKMLLDRNLVPDVRSLAQLQELEIFGELTNQDALTEINKVILKTTVQQTDSKTMNARETLSMSIEKKK